MTACVAHPVGPARTYAKYEGKAVTTAEAVLSAVQTGRLSAETASRGNAFGPYVGTVVSEAEASASGAQGTFASVQPPDERADQLSAELDALMSAAVRHLADLRVAARRNELRDLVGVAQPLDADARALQAFIEGHR
jgi:hypothetical protein